jgi:hypothetical protein
MTLMLDLSPELEQFLLQSAQRQGVTVEALTLQVLTGVMTDRVESLIPPGAVCEVWSPYEAFEAAEVMMKVLQETQVQSNE